MGAAMALALAKEGANVVINYVTPSSKGAAEKVAAGVETEGSQAFVVQADLSSLKDIDLLVAMAVERFGRIDILVGCSACFFAYVLTSPLGKQRWNCTTADDWRYRKSCHGPRK